MTIARIGASAGRVALRAHQDNTNQTARPRAHRPATGASIASQAARQRTTTPFSGAARGPGHMALRQGQPLPSRSWNALLPPPPLRVELLAGSGGGGVRPIPPATGGDGDENDRRCGPTPQPTMDIKRATQVVDDNFTQFDVAKQGAQSKADGMISREDLQVVAANEGCRFSSEEQAAAQFLLDSRAARNFLDTAADGGGVDGVIGRQDIAAAQRHIADGSHVARMLDTAATRGGWFTGPDGHVSAKDMDAALQDLGILDDVKDMLRLGRGVGASSVAEIGNVVARDGSADQKQVFIQTFMHTANSNPRVVSGVLEGMGGTVRTQYGNEDAASVAEVLASLEDDPGSLSQALTTLDNADKLDDVLWAAAGQTISTLSYF